MMIKQQQPHHHHQQQQQLLLLLLLIFFTTIIHNNGVITAIDPSLELILQNAGYDKVDWTIHDPSQIIIINSSSSSSSSSTQHFIAATGKAQEDGYNCGIETWYRNEDDGGDWKPGQCLFQTKPNWVDQYVSGNDGAFWAPELVNSNTLLYSVSDMDDYYGTTCVGVAFATSTGGSGDITQLSWVDSGEPLTCIYQDDYEEERSAIDPTVFTGFDGKTYLVTGGGVIHGTEVNESTLKPLSGNFFSVDDPSWVELARGEYLTNEDEYDWVEAPYVWPIESNGVQYYFLFVNWGACCSGKQSTYNIRVGRSTSPLGPFVDKNNKDLMDGGGSLLLETDGYVIGPGHVGIYDDSIMTFHYYDERRVGGASWVAEKSISIVNGWPVLGDELLSSYGSGGGSNTSTYNDSPFRFKVRKQGRWITRDCIWVSKDTSSRCALNGVPSMCADTCNINNCLDGNAKFKVEWKGKQRTRKCTWVAKKQTAKRCNIDGMKDTCRDTCGQC